MTVIRCRAGSRPSAFPRAWWALLREDLTALTYSMRGNQIQLVKKEDLLIRLGRSPDAGDAVIQ